jgi:hypothetical protein
VCSLLIHFHIHNQFLARGKRDVIGKKVLGWYEVLIWSKEGGRVPVAVMCDGRGKVADCFRYYTPFERAGSSTECQSESHQGYPVFWDLGAGLLCNAVVQVEVAVGQLEVHFRCQNTSIGVFPSCCHYPVDELADDPTKVAGVEFVLSQSGVEGGVGS